MDQLLQIAAVSISQMALVFFKQLNIRTIVKHRIYVSMLITFMTQVAWLVSSALGINAFLNDNWLIVGVYLLSGVIGTYLNFKVRV
jgi:hypothetical protein